MDLVPVNVAPLLEKRSERDVTGLAGAALTAVLAVVAFPPSAVSAVAFVAFAPLMMSVRGASPRRAFVLGSVAGALMSGAGFALLARAAAQHEAVGPARALLCWAGLTCLDAVVVALPLAVAARAGPGRCLALAPPLLACAEAVVPRPLPWAFGASIVPCPPAAQIADALGAPGASLVAFSSAAVVAELALGAWRRRPPSARATLLGASFVVFAALYGWVRTIQIDRAVEAAPRVAVGLVHVAGDGKQGLSPSELGTRSAKLAARGATLVVAGETAVGGRFPASDLGAVAPRALGSVVVPILFGARVTDGGTMVNSAVLVTPAGDLGRYDKRRLVPFAEAAFTSGGARAPLEVDGAALTTTICYEDLFGPYVRSVRNETGGAILVNLTTDAWVDDEGAALHLGLAQLRAIENGRAMLRVAHGGVTAVVSPGGEVAALRKPGEAGDVVASVPLLEEPTLFGRLGHAPLGAVVLLLVAAAIQRPGLRSSAPS